MSISGARTSAYRFVFTGFALAFFFGGFSVPKHPFIMRSTNIWAISSAEYSPSVLYQLASQLHMPYIARVVIGTSISRKVPTSLQG